MQARKTLMIYRLNNNNTNNDNDNDNNSSNNIMHYKLEECHFKGVTELTPDRHQASRTSRTSSGHFQTLGVFVVTQFMLETCQHTLLTCPFYATRLPHLK